MEDIKGHKAYIQILKQMTPSQKLQKVFEMSQFAKDLFYQGLKRRFPELSEEELKQLYIERINQCHNRNY